MKPYRRLLAYSAVAVGLAWSAGLSAQEKKIACAKVPKAVHAAFEKAFPKAVINSCATEIEDGKTVFEIASKEGEIGRDVLYRPDGSVIVVEETMAVEKMPDAVQQAVKAKYPGGSILRSESVTQDGTVLYEFQLRHQGKLTEAQFDPRGTEVPKKP